MQLKKLLLFVALALNMHSEINGWDFGDHHDLAPTTALVYYRQDLGKVVVVTCDGIQTIAEKEFPYGITWGAGESPLKYAELHGITPESKEFDVVAPTVKRVLWHIVLCGDCCSSDILHGNERGFEALQIMPYVEAYDSYICEHKKECETLCRCAAGVLEVNIREPRWRHMLRMLPWFIGELEAAIYWTLKRNFTSSVSLDDE